MNNEEKHCKNCGAVFRYIEHPEWAIAIYCRGCGKDIKDQYLKENNK